MPSILNENIRFFSKSGADINPTLVDGIWTGSTVIDRISVGLHEVAHIFILENIINSTDIISRTATISSGSPIVTITSGTTQGLKPGMWISGTGIPANAVIFSISNLTQFVITENATSSGSYNLQMHSKRYDLTFPRSTDSTINVRLENSDDVFYLFDVAYETDMPVIIKELSHEYTPDDGSSDVLIFEHRNLAPSTIKKDAIQVNIAAIAIAEGTYTNAVIIEEIDSDGTSTRLARFDLYFESEGEDERFRSMLENNGQVISNNEYVAFRNTDIKEDRIDYKHMNHKRKEMLIAGNDIWPYLGSYKGFVNALKFFGYGDLRLKEYWLNVDESSSNEGKMITMNVPLSLEYTDTELQDYKRFIDNILPNEPSSVYKKTAKFALFYDINRETGEYDEDGLPETEDVFEFTNEEILIKLFSLKNILKEKFLPLNARIIDITGEGVYYDNIGINSWNIPTPTIHVDVERDINFTATPLVGFLKDLTSTEYANCDLTIGTKLSDKADVVASEYAFCMIRSDEYVEGTEVVAEHTRYARTLGLPVTITNISNDYTWDELHASWEDAADKTWENFNYQDYQTIRWIVRSVDKNIIIVDKKAPIEELLSIDVVLPYLGYYDVTMEVLDHFNFPHRITKQDYIQVRPQEADMVAVFRRHDPYDTWEDIENSDRNLAIMEMHGTWTDITIGDDTTWAEAADVTWEAVDWATYANQEGLFDYFDNSMVNTSNEKVGQIIGLTPQTHKIRVRGFNNYLLKNKKQQSAYFFKDRSGSSNLVLDIVANGAGNFTNLNGRTNQSVHFATTTRGWIVGEYGKFMSTTDGGNHWISEISGTTNNLNHAQFLNENLGWIVGDFGTVLKYTVRTLDGVKRIEQVNVGTVENLNAVHFIDQDTGYISGDYGTILKTTDGGNSWRSVAPTGIENNNIESIYFPTPGLGVAVTNNGKILRTIDAGLTWAVTSYVNPFAMLTVFFLNANVGWIGGSGYSNILKTTNGGLTWVEYAMPFQGNPAIVEGTDFVPFSIKFANDQLGFAAGSGGRLLRSIDGGQSWAQIPAYGFGNTFYSVYALDSQVVYVVGGGGIIFKSVNGGVDWIEQTNNQPSSPGSGSNSDIWITEPYGGTILQNEQAILCIKYIPTTITWDSENVITTTWPVGSLQSALNASHIYFTVGSTERQFSIKSATLLTTNEIEYVIHQMVYDDTGLTSAFVVESHSAVYIDSTPKAESGGIRIQWKNVWTNDTVSVLNNMCILLRLDSSDYYCDVLDMEFDGDDAILQMDWQCDVVSKLDPDYWVALKEYDIQEVNAKLGTINTSWATFCQEVTWNDMSDKTWNDFEFNGMSYCSFIIASVARGGIIKVDNTHMFQFKPESILEIECELVSGSGYITTENTSEIEIGMMIHGDGIAPGSYVTFIDSPTIFIISESATTTGNSECSLTTPNISLDEAVVELNNSDIEGIRDFVYSRPLQADGLTQVNYITAVAKIPGVSGLHYFEFLNGVESDWADSLSETHSYPLGVMKNWTKSIADGGQPIGENNPPLWNHIYNTYYEFGEWFPVMDKLGEYSEHLDSMRMLYSQALDGSFNLQDTAIKRWRAKATPGTTMFISSFPSKIIGIRNQRWKLYDDNTGKLLVEVNNEFLIWTFCNQGTYSVELFAEDIAGNPYKVRRQGFIEIRSREPELDSSAHMLPGMGHIPPSIPPNAPIPTTVTPPPTIDPVDPGEPIAVPDPPSVIQPVISLHIYTSVGFETPHYDQERYLDVTFSSPQAKFAALSATEFYLGYYNKGKYITESYPIASAKDEFPDNIYKVRWDVGADTRVQYLSKFNEINLDNDLETSILYSIYIVPKNI